MLGIHRNNNEDIKEKCIELIAHTSKKTVGQINNIRNRDCFFMNADMDSLDIACVFLDIERKLGITITDEKIDTMKSLSLNQILQEIETEYLKQKSKATPTYVGQFSGLRHNNKGTAFCELLNKPCDAPEKINTTSRVYCDFIECQLYNSFQKLR